MFEVRCHLGPERQMVYVVGCPFGDRAGNRPLGFFAVAKMNRSGRLKQLLH